MVSAPALRLSPDPAVWFIGPDDERPYERWLPEAVELMMAVAQPPRRERARTEHFLTMMLGRIGRVDDHPLPYRVIKWLDLRQLPVVVYLGLVSRDAEAVEAFLRAEDSAAVEPPVITHLPAAPGVIARRSLAYSQVEGELFVQTRYVVDDADPEVVVCLQAGQRSPGRVVSALEDLDALATHGIGVTRSA